jgi:hypothetical protein
MLGDLRLQRLDDLPAFVRDRGCVNASHSILPIARLMQHRPLTIPPNAVDLPQNFRRVAIKSPGEYYAIWRRLSNVRSAPLVGSGHRSNVVVNLAAQAARVRSAGAV